VAERLAAYGGRLAVAAVNGPSATVVSGEPDAIEELVAAYQAQNVRARVLPVDYASHGPQVEELRAEILAALEGIAPRAAVIPMVSAMTGEVLAGHEAGARYWYESLRAPVRFAAAVEALAASGHRVFIEASPHPVLAAAVTDTLDALGSGPAAVVTGTLRREDGGTARLLASLGEAYTRGAAVDWAAVLPPADRVELPTIPSSISGTGRTGRGPGWRPVPVLVVMGRRPRSRRGSGPRSKAATCGGWPTRSRWTASGRCARCCPR
jgi:acyl transferase domain-containing protein